MRSASPWAPAHTQCSAADSSAPSKWDSTGTKKWPFELVTLDVSGIPTHACYVRLYIHLDVKKQSVDYIKEGGWCVYALVSDFLIIFFYPILNIIYLQWPKSWCVQKLSICTYPITDRALKCGCIMYILYTVLTNRVNRFFILKYYSKTWF